ncbi:hypothetical protein RI367_004966 [Sorochytrium milnesiophthora]
MPAFSVSLCAVLITLAALASGAAVRAPQGQACTPRVRTEVRALTPDQWNRYATAVNELKNKKGNLAEYQHVSLYDQYTLIHAKMIADHHDDPRFLPWHSLFLLKFEEDLRAIDPTVALPYWSVDEIDSQAPENSTLLTSAYYGVCETNNCVRDGRFPFTVTVDNVGNPVTPQCIQRNCHINRTTPTRFINHKEVLKMGSVATSFSNFSLSLNNAHSQVHFWVGGEMGYLERAPRDAVFYALHGWTDKVWRDFQASSTLPYEGSQYTNVKRTVSMSDPLTPFTKPDGSPYTVADVWDPATTCVSYAPVSQALMAPPSIPASGSVPVPASNTTVPASNTTVPVANATIVSVPATSGNSTLTTTQTFPNGTVSQTITTGNPPSTNQSTAGSNTGLNAVGGAGIVTGPGGASISTSPGGGTAPTAAMTVTVAMPDASARQPIVIPAQFFIQNHIPVVQPQHQIASTLQEQSSSYTISYISHSASSSSSSSSSSSWSSWSSSQGAPPRCYRRRLRA